MKRILTIISILLVGVQLFAFQSSKIIRQLKAGMSIQEVKKICGSEHYGKFDKSQNVRILEYMLLDDGQVLHYRCYLKEDSLFSCFKTNQDGDYGNNLLYHPEEISYIPNENASQATSQDDTYLIQKTKLQQLKELLDEQLISEEDYQNKKKIIVDEIMETNQPISDHSIVYIPNNLAISSTKNIDKEETPANFEDVEMPDNDNIFKGVSKGFEGQLKIPFIEGFKPQKNFSFGIDFIASYRFNAFCRLGGGIGLQYVKLKYEDAKTIDYKYFKEYYESALSIPLFANIKFDFMQTKCSPFFSCDVGYKFYVPFSKYAKNNKLGFFVSPVLGLDIRFDKCVLSIGVGYEYQQRSFSDELLDVKYDGYSSITEFIAIAF